jgi:predicted porin
MQKKIIALAVAGLVSGGAFAQSNVTISGTIGVSMNNYSLNGATTARTTYRQTNVSDESSAIILSGSEDLGGGMKAVFQIDSRLTMDRGRGTQMANTSAPYTTPGLGDGNTFVGIATSVGQFNVGRVDLHYDALGGIENLGIANSLAARFGHFGIMSQVQGTQIALGTRASNVAFYVSPVIQGFKLTAGWSPNGGGGEGEAISSVAGDPTQGSSAALKLNYDNGPITAVYSYFNHRVEGRDVLTGGWAINTATGALFNTTTATAAPNPNDQISNRLGAAYTFKNGFKAGLAWDRSTIKFNTVLGDRTRTAWMVPVSYTTGPHVLAFNYTKAGRTSGQVATLENTTASQYMLGYAYTLSKRTTLGVQYIALTNKADATYSMGPPASGSGLTAPVAGEDAKLTTFNIRHSF